MPRHVQARGGRVARLGVVAILWLAGLGTGFYAILSVGARYGCARTDEGLACGTTGTALGALLILAVILVVTAGTVFSQDAGNWRVRVIYVVAALVLLGACLVGAHALLATV
jgi:hypothetical protein